MVKAPAGQAVIATRGDGSLAWIQAEESWWAKEFMIARADGSDPLRVPAESMHLYKIRWID